MRGDYELDSVEVRLSNLRVLMDRGEFAAASHLAAALYREFPENIDAGYALAVSQRYLGRVADALSTLAALEVANPHFSRIFQERGHCYVILRQAKPAIESYLRAVNLNPALPASWKALRHLFRLTGQSVEAAQAAEHLEVLAVLPAEVCTATGLFADGDVSGAERLLRDFLLRAGDHVEAMRLLAKIGMKLEVLDDAELLLERALQLTPGYRALRYDYALTLLRRHKHAQALEQIEQLIALDSGNRAYRITQAAACVGLGRHEQATAMYRSLLDETPGVADLHLSIAHGLKTLGRQTDAISAYKSAVDARPEFGDAYWSLANLKTYRFSDAEIEQMRRIECRPEIGAQDRYHLCFALGKALEDQAEYGESFAYYQRGNVLKRSELRFSMESIERDAQVQINVCTREFLSPRRHHGCPADDPIFIVGLPRAGSTLIEQILASHSHVEGTMELSNILRIAASLNGRASVSRNPRYPAVLEHLTPENYRELGEKYLSETRVYRTGKARFIDKMPNNFRHLGLIHLMLPNARIIDARREAMSCCFSNYKQLYASGQEFTYDLVDIARYYRSYIALMAHWEATLPNWLLRVDYEDLVVDLESNVRRILNFCGLDYEPACLEFHKTERSVRTASSEQVRRPIYRQSVDQWRHYERWLAPLQNALGNVYSVNDAQASSG